MSEEANRGRPPHNPWLRDLIAGKRRWSARPKRDDALAGFKGWHERGYLPHRDEPGLIQFITFHLKDSFPAALRSEWAALWKIEDEREKRLKLEAYLDKGRGHCWLKRPEIARLVDAAVRFYHPSKYQLQAWVVMPNHVHMLIRTGPVPMGTIIGQLKEYTARKANESLGRQGQFWEKDFWDTYMRDDDQTLRAKRYVEANPVKASLVRTAKEWPWSSAAFRDEYGNLTI